MNRERRPGPAADIWPWLVQMGPGRAGAYTYGWIENLFWLGMHSADEPEPDRVAGRLARRAGHEHLPDGAGQPGHGAEVLLGIKQRAERSAHRHG